MACVHTSHMLTRAFFHFTASACASSAQMHSLYLMLLLLLFLSLSLRCILHPTTVFKAPTPLFKHHCACFINRTCLAKGQTCTWQCRWLWCYMHISLRLSHLSVLTLTHTHTRTRWAAPPPHMLRHSYLNSGWSRTLSLSAKSDLI